MKIKKEDNVIIVTGKDKGKKGKVLRAFPKADRVLVEGINVRKVAVKARRSGEKGKIVEKAMPIHVSNVMVVDSKSNKPSRVGYVMKGDVKVRITKKSGAEI